MTITLHLGVQDVPYAWAPAKPRAAKPPRGKAVKMVKEEGSQHATTGAVAEWLENKYHIMEIFFNMYDVEIVKAVEHSYVGAIENLFAGGAGAVSTNPLASAEAELEESFKYFLESEEMADLGVPGVPTQAALDGVNHRLKIKKGERRPSFIDTGLYQANFRAWFDQE